MLRASPSLSSRRKRNEERKVRKAKNRRWWLRRPSKILMESVLFLGSHPVKCYLQKRWAKELVMALTGTL